MIQAKFGLNWPCGFRGEDYWKSLQTDDGRKVMAIAHTGELKSQFFFIEIEVKGKSQGFLLDSPPSIVKCPNVRKRQ